MEVVLVDVVHVDLVRDEASYTKQHNEGKDEVVDESRDSGIGGWRDVDVQLGSMAETQDELYLCHDDHGECDGLDEVPEGGHVDAGCDGVGDVAIVGRREIETSGSDE